MKAKKTVKQSSERRRSADRRNEKRAHPRVALVPSPTERRRTERRELKKK